MASFWAAHLRGLFGLFIILSAYAKYAASAPPLQSTSSSPSTNLVEMILQKLPANKLSPEEIKQKCPDLWAYNSTEFSEATGKFGYISQLEETCYSNKRGELSKTCEAAARLSRYLCQAASSHFPAPPRVADVNHLNSAAGVCKAAGDRQLMDKVCLIVKNQIESLYSSAGMASNPTISSSLDDNCRIPIKFQMICLLQCSGDNLAVCKMILQQVRTLVYWRDFQSNEKPASAKAEQAPPVNDSVKSQSSFTTESAGSTESTVGQKDSEMVVATNQTVRIPPIPVETLIEKTPLVTNIDPSVNEVVKQVVPKVEDKEAKMDMTPAGPSNQKEAPAKVAEPVTQATTPTVIHKETLPATTTLKSEIVEEAIANLDPDYDLNNGQQRASSPDDAYEDLVPTEDDELKVNAINVNNKKPASSSESSSEIDEPENTHFLLYFMTFVVLSAGGYVLYQRRGRVLTFFLGQRSSRGRRGSDLSKRQRSGSYKKLVNNLEEAMTSSSSNVKNSNVIY